MAVSPTGGIGPVVKMTAASDAITGNVAVNFLYWVSKGATVGDDLLITDSADVAIWEAVADATNFAMIFPVKNAFSGVKVGTIDSGSLYVVKANSDRQRSY